MRRTLVVLLMLILTGVAVCAQNSNAAKPKASRTKASAVDCATVDDTALAKNVNDRLAATPSLKGQAITATANAGAVTLTGKVKTGLNKGTATRVARAVKCVQSLTNNLEVEIKTAVPDKSKAANKNM